jgi:syntaxin 5
LLVRAAVEATNGGGGGGDDVSSTALQVLAPNVARASADDAYLTSRAHAVENVERTLVELGEMYTRLAHIVEAQAEITVRIDANMDAAIEHVDAGHRHLLTYHDSIGQSRWLIAKVFAVLLAFLVFFMLFIA